MLHSERDYITVDLFPGDEALLSLRRVRMVKSRKEYPCYFSICPGGKPHTIKPGEHHRYESAMVDGDFFGSYRVCIPCLDKYIAGEF